MQAAFGGIGFSCATGRYRANDGGWAAVTADLAIRPICRFDGPMETSSVRYLSLLWFLIDRS